jgi:secreted trypsin-like serine protease
MAMTIVIVGGKPVPSGLMLSTVGVLYGASRVPECTGTLIQRDIVLTAGHCVCGEGPNVSKVFVGTTWTQATASDYYNVTGYRSALLPGQCTTGLREGRDLALLKLQRPVTGVQPMAFASDRQVSGATSYRVAGFGAIDRNATEYPDQKQEAKVTALSNDCRGGSGNPDARRYGCKPTEEIVAGRRFSPDTCEGDSGGPLLVTASGTGGNGPADLFWLAGATSRGVVGSPDTCGHGGIYERLTPGARQWINEKVRELRRP